MELHLQQQQISAFALAARRTAEERFSSDCVVPDSLPDAASLLLTEGDLCLWRLDLGEGSAELEGEICIRVCYLAENGDPSGFPVNIPVTLRFRGEELHNGLRPQLHCRVSDLTGQLLNSRKLRIQGRMTCELSCFDSRELCLTTGIEDEEKGLYQRCEPTAFSVVSAVEESVFSVSDSPALRLGFPADGQLLSHHSDPVLDETQTLDNRLILKGRVITTLLYRDAQRGELLSETVETPFSQLIDVFSDNPVSASDTVLYLTSEKLQCRNDDPAIDTEFHLVAQSVCYAQVETECVTDAYSTRGSVSLSWETESLHALPSEPRREYAEEVLPCDSAGKTVCAARAALRGDRAEIVLLLTDAEGRLSVQSGPIALPDGAKTDCTLETPSVSPCPEGFAVRLPFLLREASETPPPLRQISSAQLEPSEETDLRPGVKLVRRTNDDLWTLAKLHASSEEAIRAVNLATDPPSRWLLIPRVI